MLSEPRSFCAALEAPVAGDGGGVQRHRLGILADAGEHGARVGSPARLFTRLPGGADRDRLPVVSPSQFPPRCSASAVCGRLLLLLAAAARAAAGLFYMQPLDGWTLPLSVAGVVWLLYGWLVLRWCLPSIIFLWFMVPLPFASEKWLSLPLQNLATKLSTFCLVCFGQPAIAQGHTILIGDKSLGVEEACSGLRIFVGVYALAFAFVLFSRWNWWQKVMVLVAALPIAVCANVARIVTTGLLQQLVSTDAGKKFTHDLSGLFVEIPLALLLLWLFLLYLEKLFPVVEDVPVLPPQAAD